MSKIIDSDAALSRLCRVVAACGVRPLAREWGVAPSSICDTLSRRRPMPRKIAEKIGLRRAAAAYEVVPEKGSAA